MRSPGTGSFISRKSCNRREFLVRSATAAACSMVGAGWNLGAASGRGERPMRLRTVTYNVLGCRGYSETEQGKARLESAAGQIAARTAMELAIYQPDLITFQEGPSRAAVEAIARELKMNSGFWPGGWKGSKSYPDGFPGAVITRYPIVELENSPRAGGGPGPEDLFTRHWGRAVLETQYGHLALFSAHLHPSDDTVRAREITEVLKVIQPAIEQGGLLLFQGDLNHTPDGPDYPRWREAGLVDSFAQQGSGAEGDVRQPSPGEAH